MIINKTILCFSISNSIKLNTSKKKDFYSRHSIRLQLGQLLVIIFFYSRCSSKLVLTTYEPNSKRNYTAHVYNINDITRKPATKYRISFQATEFINEAPTLGAACRKYPCLTLFNLLSVCVYAMSGLKHRNFHPFE